MIQRLVAVVAAGLLAASPAWAAVTTYTSQATFIAAAGSTTLVTFNDFASEVSFQTSPVDAGPFSLLGFGNQVDRNFIDLPPAQFAVLDVDGTAFVNGFVSQLTGAGFALTFHAPIRAFGATFASLQDDFVRTAIEIAGATVTPPVQLGNTLQFFGVVSDTDFTTVRFVSAGSSDGFGMDNVLFASAVAAPAPVAVPAPSGSVLALGLLGMLTAVLRRRPKPA